MTLDTMLGLPENNPTCDVYLTEPKEEPKEKPKPKRTIVHFAGDKPIAMNLEHVSIIRQEGNSLYFDFHTKTQQVDMADEEAAKAALQTLMNLWTGDVLVD